MTTIPAASKLSPAVYSVLAGCVVTSIPVRVTSPGSVFPTV